MVRILRKADERPVPEVARKHGASAQTIYVWRKHLGNLESTDVKRRRQVEHQNQRPVVVEQPWAMQNAVVS